MRTLKCLYGLCMAIVVLQIAVFCCGSAIASPRSPISVKLEMQSFPPVGGVAEVVCTAKADWDLINCRVEINLPESVSLIQGTTTWTGDLKPGVEQVFSVRIRVNSVGNFHIQAVVKGTGDDGGTYTATDYVLFNVGIREGKKGYVSKRGVNSIAAQALETPRLVEIVGPEEAEEAVEESPVTTEEPPALDTLNVQERSSSDAVEKSSAGLVQVYGRILYHNRAYVAVPANYCLVAVQNGSGSRLAWAWTDSQGNFRSPWFPNPGSKGVRVRVYTYVKWAPNNYELLVVKPGGDSLDDTYYVTSPTFAVADGAQWVGSWTVNSPRSNIYAKAFWIKADLTQGFLFCPQQPGKCCVRWPADMDGHSGYMLGGAVRITLEHADFQYMVLHEMAHNIMYNVYDRWWPDDDCPDPHYLTQVSGSSCGWTEGWADFFPMAVARDPRVWWGLDLEAATWTSLWARGPKVEGRVAGALWDLMDGVNDGYDRSEYGFRGIWDVLYKYNTSTFGAFFLFWMLSGKDDCGAVSCLYQNTIDFNSAPVWLSMPTVPSICQGGTANNAIDLWKYVVDGQCSDEQLRYSVYSVSNSNLVVVVDGNRYADFRPAANWSGYADVRFRVSDGISSAASSPVRITVTRAAITVGSPTGGDIWAAGTVHAITWKSSCIQNVRIDYSTNGGANWMPIIASTPNTGSYSWRVPAANSVNCQVRVADLDGVPFGVSQGSFSIRIPIAALPGEGEAIPNTFAVAQNYPNPFNPVTQIAYEVPVSSHVRMVIYNVNGQRIKTLVDGPVAPGRYNVLWDGRDDSGNDVAAGIYFLRFETEGFSCTRKMVMVK